MDAKDLVAQAAESTSRLEAQVGKDFGVETFLKTGRSRTFSLVPSASVMHSDELGWATRVHGARTSGFACGTGSPRLPLLAAQTAMPALPSLEEARGSGAGGPSGSRELDAPLLSEGEGISWLRSVAERLREELPDARLLRAVLEDGASVAALASSEGVQAAERYRVAALRLEAVARDPRCGSILVTATARSARSFVATSIARRLADRLAIAERGVSPESSSCRAVLSPEVGAAILESLVPLFVGPRLWSVTRRLAGDRWGGSQTCLVDDPHLAQGLLPAASDGEGVRTERRLLIDGGRLRQPLLSRAHEEFAVEQGLETVGCRFRHTYRMPPEASPSHLFLTDTRTASVSQLVNELGGGYYFIDVTGPVRRHYEESWLEVPVCGFQVRGRRATAHIKGARLRLDLRHFFRSILGVGRDLRFRPRRGCVGSPSLLIEGAEVVPD